MPINTTRLDPDSAEWLRALAASGPQREMALARLHGMLRRIAQAEARRRGPRVRITGPELDDLACQAAADALMAITAKLGQFRGESRFTTWAHKFVILEVSAKLGRHFWRRPDVPLEAGDWDRLPDRFGFEPARESEWRDLLAAQLRRDAGISHYEYQVLAMLSQAPGRTLRMSVLATQTDGSLPRLSQVVARLIEWLSCHREKPLGLLPGPMPISKAMAGGKAAAGRGGA